MKQRAEALILGDPYAEDTTTGPLISHEHREKVMHHYRLALQEGAELVTGGNIPDFTTDERLNQGAWISPTIFTGLDDSSATQQQEIFGPVCHITPFSDEDEAIAMANNTDYGLAAAVWTDNLSRGHRVAAQMDVGISWVNTWFLRDLRTPFGGGKMSGIGREGGVHSLDSTLISATCVSNCRGIRMSGLNKGIALKLREAYKQGQVPPIRNHLLENSGDVNTAYDIQDINTSFWLAEGRRIVGRKIGLTSRAVQQQLDVDSPDMGVLFADMAVPSGNTVNLSSMLQPKIEAEVALILGADLDYPACTTADIISAIDYLLPAIEIVDSRVKNWGIKIWDTVADNASSAGFVLGNRPVKLGTLTWPSAA